MDRRPDTLDLRHRRRQAVRVPALRRQPPRPREFDLHTDNASGTGIWSDGTTIWVADRADDKVYAYSLEDGTRQESKEFDLHSDNDDPTGIWSDGYTIWVADDRRKIYAYGLESGEREANQDFNTPSAAQNRDVADIWSDGATMWVVD